MKKFSFSLEKVLRFKTQIERNLRNEHANIVQEVQRQEAEVDRLENEYRNATIEFEEVKRSGATISRLRGYEDYCKALRQSIVSSKQLLSILKQKEERKREEVIEAKKETASFDLLKEKRLAEYNEDARKASEREIEEFIASSMHHSQGA